MEDNTTKVRYPFHGFYRKLLPDGGYAENELARQLDQDRAATMQHTVLPTLDTVEPPTQQIEAVEQTQTALAPADTGTAVTETVTCDAVQEGTEQEPRYVADVIGDDFKTWGPGLVAIEASTGTGKTSFVLNQMLDWAEEQACVKFPHKRILILCNRVPLKADIQRKLDIKKAPMLVEDGFGGYTCIIDDADLVHIQTYQYYETMLVNAPEKVKRDLQSYPYIVCDEAHYFVDDASFNPNTGLMYDTLLELAESKTVIFMTATPGFMFESWRRQGKLDKNRDYCLYRKSDWITKAVVYQKDQLKTILDAIPADEKAVVIVRRTERLDEIKSWYGDAAGCYCSENNSKTYDELENCIKDGRLQRHIVAVTQVLYNGIDITDPTVKHIIIEDYEPTKVIQEIGRKRSQGVADACTVYFRELTPKECSGFSGWINYILEVAEACWKRKRGERQAWVNLLKKKNASKQIEDAIGKNYISYDYATGACDMNRMSLERLREKRAELESIREVGYWQFMQEDVWGKILNVELQNYTPDALIDYINTHIGIQMTKKEMQEGLLQLGMYTEKRTPKSPEAMSEAVECYGAMVKSIRKKMRVDGKSTTITCWMLEKM